MSGEIEGKLHGNPERKVPGRPIVNVGKFPLMKVTEESFQDANKTSSVISEQ